MKAVQEQGPFRIVGSSVARRIAKTKESTFLLRGTAIFHSGANETVIRLNSIRIAAAALKISAGITGCSGKYSAIHSGFVLPVNDTNCAVDSNTQNVSNLLKS